MPTATHISASNSLRLRRYINLLTYLLTYLLQNYSDDITGRRKSCLSNQIKSQISLLQALGP